MTLQPDWKWEARDIPLKFDFGGFRLGVVKLKGIELTTPFGDRMDTPVPLPDLTGGIQAALIRSFPAAGIPTQLPDSRYFLYIPRRYRRHYAGMTGTMADYLQKFSSKSRSTLQRKVRKFGEVAGEGSFQLFRAPAELAEFYREARLVSATTYQERNLDAGLPQSEEFQAEMMELAAQDRARAYLLRHQGVVVAYLYCPIQNGVLLYSHLGYNPAYSSLSPGTVLQYHAFEHLFSEGTHRMFDFTEGEGQHKEFFATGNVSCADVYLLRRTLKGRGVAAIHDLVARTSRWGSEIAERHQVKSRLKRIVRRTGG